MKRSFILGSSNKVIISKRNITVQIQEKQLCYQNRKLRFSTTQVFTVHFMVFRHIQLTSFLLFLVVLVKFTRDYCR